MNENISGMAVDDAASKQVLRERARRLAEPRQEEEAGGFGAEVLEFRISGDHFALPLSVLREIHPLRLLGTIPGTPDFVRGVVVVRGQVVSVLDLRLLLGLSPTEFREESYGVILENHQMVFALMADQVDMVRRIHEDEFEAGKPSSERLNHPYISAITGERVIILDGEKLLSDPALIVNG